MLIDRQVSLNLGVGTWNGFEKLAGGPQVISNPIVPANNYQQLNDGCNQINVFMIGSDHAVYHLTQVGPNSDSWAFERLGGYVIGDPGIGFRPSSVADGSIVFELFVVGSDKALYYSQNPTYNICP